MNLANSPLISVVMITYNHENFIQQAIEGVLIQEFSGEIELIIANDCSPDGTDTVIKTIIENHPRGAWIKYTNHPVNMGMMNNFIWALKQAKGKYIALCEGDDYWIDPLKLQKQVDFLENNEEYNLITSNAIIDKVKLEKVYGHINNDFSFDFEKQITSSCCVTCTSMFRKNQMKGIDNYLFQMLKIGDLLLWALLLRNHKKGYFANENWAYYRIHSGGVYSQGTKKENKIDELNVYETLVTSECFSNSEMKIMQYRIQTMWYSFFCNENWFAKSVSYGQVLKNLNILNFNSVLLFVKCKLKFFLFNRPFSKKQNT